jgi:hypothetical protein
MSCLPQQDAHLKSVFVINEPKGSRLALGKYGRVIHVCPGWIENRDLIPTLDHLVDILEKCYQDGDYVVLGGHAKLNSVAFHWVMLKHKVLRQLLPAEERWFVQLHDGRESSAERGIKWWHPQ